MSQSCEPLVEQMWELELEALGDAARIKMQIAESARKRRQFLSPFYDLQEESNGGIKKR